MTDKLGSLDPAVASELDEILSGWRRAIELELRVCAQATVMVYDPATQRATIQLGALPVKLVQGEEIPDAPIVIPNVPVLWMGSATAYVAGSLLPGDGGLALFTDRCLAAWLRDGVPTDPLNGRTHSLGDAVFYPGLRPTTQQIAPPPIPAALTLEGAQIRLGATAVNHLVMAETLHTYMVAMITAAATAALDGGATFKAGLLTYLGANPFTSYMTTKVTAE